ncbi:MAG: hypothetical protein ACI3YC_07515, partial [Alloprevotella sp.]
LLTPKPKACHHLLAEGSHPLQGDKPYDKHKTQRGKNATAESLFHVYRLVMVAKPERVMLWASENLGA